MGTVSTVPLVRDALVSSLTDAVAVLVAPVPTVVTGRPADANVRRHTIIVASDVPVHDWDIPTMKAGRKHRQEEYELGVFISISPARGTVEEVQDRAYSILAQLDDILADDVHAGVANQSIISATLARSPMSSGHDKEGPWCQIPAVVRIRARLT